MNIIERITPIQRKILLILSDLTICTGSLVVAAFLTGSLNDPAASLKTGLWAYPIFISVRILCLHAFKLYSVLWRYATLTAVTSIIKSVTLGTLINIVLLNVILKTHIPIQIWVVDWSLTLIGIGGGRLSLSLFRNHLKLKQCKRNGRKKTHKNMLIIGAGDCGEQIAREIVQNQSLHYTLVGFVDDKACKQTQLIHEKPILGTIQEIPRVVCQHHIDTAVIAIPSATSKTIRNIVTLCQNAHLDYKITPGLSEIISGKVSLSEIRDIQISDLIGRESVEKDLSIQDNYIQDKVVLITGAGGSIGSELSRQVHGLSPKQLLLLDTCEGSLFEIEHELKSTPTHANTTIPILANIRCKKRLTQIFETYHPDIIFHAAAFKHVPLMEHHVKEAIDNNITGTHNLASLASEYGATKFVFISTDKAVNPTNVMGATKRICEILMQLFDTKSRTTFTSVRFGNVLGSRGSVIPIFKKQIQSGGPITVTHPDVERYFMTIPEAVRLVIQTGSLGKGGETFILDMGHPIKIMQLAKDLIQLSGLKEGIDISINITGLRPGEKMKEELFYGKNIMKKTRHPKILIYQETPYQETEAAIQINHLIENSETHNDEALKKQLFALTKATHPDLLRTPIPPQESAPTSYPTPPL